MREIKFRARNADVPPCWIYGYFVIENDCCYIINKEGKFKVIAGTESQYTRRKDKNGKEIYEGDLFKHTIDRHEQVTPYRVTSIEELYYDINTLDSYLRLEPSSFEVIGNIYENPELIK